MKKQNFLSNALSKELTRNRRQYFWITGLFLLGILTGAISAALSDSMPEMKEYFNTFLSAYPLQGTAKAEVFKLSLLHYLQLALLLWSSGWYVWLFLLGPLQVLGKGFRIGFTVVCLLRCFRIRGILFAVFSILPPNLIFIPTLFFFAVYQIHFLSDRRYLAGGSVGNQIKKQIYGKNLLHFGCFLLLLFLCALIEGYLVPSILRPLCGLVLP